ncbi:YibE/F family protein [Sporosarcina sp. CAU 1771]
MDKVKNMTRQQKLFYSILVTLFIASIVFVNNNYAFYDRPIAKVTDTSLIETTKITDRLGNEDTLINQQITAVLKNGVEKGRHIQLTNGYSASGAYDQEYNAGNKLFVLLNPDTGKATELTGIITDVKRDQHVLAIAWIFIFTLLLVGHRQGLFAIVSFALNVLLLSIALDIYVKYSSVSLLLITAICILLFTAISLLFVSGFNEKTYAAVAATLLGTLTSLAITYFVFWGTAGNGLRYEEMQFLTRPYETVFMAGLFIGSLGAIMDVAITMSSSIFALYNRDPNISIKSLTTSGMDIGRDVMGTITNILFLAYISGSIPMLVLLFKNASPLNFTLSINLSLEIARALAGGIGIVLTVPIGVYTTVYFIHRKRVKI